MDDTDTSIILVKLGKVKVVNQVNIILILY
jgi:hypothetical protein